MLNQIFGAQKQNYGNTEFWHGAERSGWLMKQGMLRADRLAASLRIVKLVVCEQQHYMWA